MQPAQRLQIRLANTDYFRESVKCQAACPVGTDAGGYVRAIAEGDFELAYLIARGPNPLASICGRVCGAPCEAACRRREIDEYVSIRALKRFASRQYYGTSAGDGTPATLLRKLIASSTLRYRRGGEDLTALLGALSRSELEPPSGARIAIIGGGPAGLAAAHDLAVLGYRPTVFEMESEPAGMLGFGIPEYRLPRDVIRAEIEVIRALGVEFRCDTEVGTDISLAEIRRTHAATVIAVGAKYSRALPLPGADGTGVLGGVELLRAISLDRSPPLGERVVVIGGGNVAFDVSRTAVRQVGFDVSRTALRASTVREVHLCCLESLEQMPADDIEIIEGAEEGVRLHPGLGPREIHLDEEGRVKAISFTRVVSVFDDAGRFAPVFDEDDVTMIETDSVLWAIGQRTDLSFLDPERDGIEVDERGSIRIDPDSLQTSASDVFVSGEAGYAPGLMIKAVASGKQVARSVHAHVSGDHYIESAAGTHTCIPRYEREKDYEKLERRHPGAAPVDERKVSQNVEVESDYSVAEAFREAARCLDCGTNTVFDSSKCILCGGCVDVCPEDCLRIVSVDRLDAADDIGSVLDDLCGELPRDEASAIIKDESRCIRCAQCVDRCPVGAVSMERFSFEGVWACRTI